MIYLKPEHGLANRIRVMVSGINLAQELNTPVTIIWELNPECNVHFNEIFNEQLIDCKVKNYKFLHRLIFYSGKKTVIRFLQVLIHRLYEIDFLFTDVHMNEFAWQYGSDVINTQKLRKKFKKNLAIRSCHEFYFNREILISRLRPAPDILKRIDEFFINEDEFIGVHIRRTDNVASIEKSPLSEFVKRIENEIEKNPSVKFYISTDTMEVIEELSNRFGKKIIYIQKNLSRNSAQGIKDAFFDIGVLSRCKKILGSYWSSFSYIASQYGNNPLEIVIKE
jgi:hypothetical protein